MDEKQLDLNAPLLSVRRLSAVGSNSDQISPNSVRKSKTTRQQSLPVPRSQWEPEEEVTKPAAVPFIWEQTPGQAKDGKKPVLQKPENPRNPQGYLSGPIWIDEHSPEDVHGDGDATETLSMSISCNYSEQNSETESSRSFSTDFQTRDYLMNRFLPAAKSMIVETPQYVVKKQEPPVLEPPKYVKKVHSGELRPLLLEKYPVSSCNQEEDKESVVVDDNVNDDAKKKLRKKGLRFLIPRICVKRASCVSNQMTGPKAKIHQSQSRVGDSPGPVPRLSRRTSYSGPLTPSLEKQAMDAVIKKRAESRPKEAHESQHKSSPFTRSGNSLPSSPQRGLSCSGRISPYRNESPRSPFHDGARFLGVPKDVQNQIVKPKTCPSLNVKSHFTPRLIRDNHQVVPEKTLYIDWVEKSSNLTPNEAKIERNGDLDGLVHVPPLPKSPSESWLWRKMTLRSPFPKKMQQAPIEKSLTNGPKWESIVKTSNVRHDHIRYSEELLSVSKYAEISF